MLRRDESVQSNVLDVANSHHISQPPEDVPISEGFCTFFAIATAASYLTGRSPEDCFRDLYCVSMATPIEDTPLATVYEKEDRPPIISYEGSTFIDKWLGGKDSELVLDYLNGVLGATVGINVGSIESVAEIDDTVSMLMSVTAEGYPVEFCVVYIDSETGDRVNHSALLSPLSTSGFALIHDSNYPEVQVLPWGEFQRLAKGYPLRVSGTTLIEVDLRKVMLKFSAIEDLSV